MQSIEGTDRTVFIAGDKAFKVAKIDTGHAVRSLTSIYGDHGLKGVQKILSLPTRAIMTPQYYMLHGVEANRREATLSRLFPNIVLATRGLMRGLLNVQPVVVPLTIDPHEVIKIFGENLGVRTGVLGHMIENPGNFGVTPNGEARFVDGGSSGLEELLLVEGKQDNIVRALKQIYALERRR